MAILLGILLLFPLVSAANIGVSPARINFDDVLRGGFSQRKITITVDSNNPIQVELKPRGEIKDWLNFTKKANVSKNSPYRLPISVSPPSDIPNGNYSGFLRLSTSTLGDAKEGHATGIVKTTLDLVINVRITDIEEINCKASSFKVESAEKGDPILFSMDVDNTGNVRLSPRVKVDIWNQEKTRVVKEKDTSSGDIRPTQEEKILIEIPSSDLEIGQYWAEVSAVDCYNTQTLTFDILEEGALKAEGKLKNIVAKPWAKEKETIPIKVKFENTGEQSIRSQFRGEVSLGDKVINLLESRERLVLTGDSKTFEFYFTPQEEGRYVVSGRVFYSGKRTFEKSAVINVKNKGLDLNSFLLPSVYLILVVGIGILIYKIRKERKSYQNKFMGLGK